MIEFYLEKGEVGGNQILLKRKNVKLWLDFGLSFKKAKRYIGLILEGRQLPKVRLSQLARQRIIPPIEVLEGTNNILLTHAHMDHYGALDILFEHNIETKIYAPPTLLSLFTARMEASNKLGLLTDSNVKLLPLRPDKENSVEEFKVVPIEVDHSIDGSYSYLIFTEDGTSIYYTGDIRFDLIPSEEIIQKLHRFTEKIDVVITELTGTNIRIPLKETDIPIQMKKVAEKYTGFILIFTTPSYTKRIKAIKEAFKHREIVIDTTYAHYLHSLGKDQFIDKLFVSLKKKSMTSWERRLVVDFSNKVADEDYLENNQKETLLIISPYRKLRVDFDLIPNSVAIVSLSEPFDEESFMYQSKLDRFLAEWKRIPAYNIHASGHADAFELSQFIEKLNPGKIFVIHSLSPEILVKMMPQRRDLFTPTYGDKFKFK